MHRSYSTELSASLENPELQQALSEWLLKKQWTDIEMGVQAAFACRIRDALLVEKLNDKLNQIAKLESALHDGTLTEPVLDLDSFQTFSKDSVNENLLSGKVIDARASFMLRGEKLKTTHALNQIRQSYLDRQMMVATNTSLSQAQTPQLTLDENDTGTLTVYNGQTSETVELSFQIRVDVVNMLDVNILLADWLLRSQKKVTNSIIARTIMDLLGSEPLANFRKPYEPIITHSLSANRVRVEVCFKSHPLPPRTSLSFSHPIKTSEGQEDLRNQMLTSTGQTRIIGKVISISQLIPHLCCAMPGEPLAPPDICFLPLEILASKSKSYVSPDRFFQRFAQFCLIELQDNICPSMSIETDFIDNALHSLGVDANYVSKPRRLVWLALTDGAAGAGTIKLGDLVDVCGLQTIGPPPFVRDLAATRKQATKSRDSGSLNDFDIEDMLPFSFHVKKEDAGDSSEIDSIFAIDDELQNQFKYESYSTRLKPLELASIWVDVTNLTLVCLETLELQRQMMWISNESICENNPLHIDKSCVLHHYPPPLSDTFDAAVWTTTLDIVKMFGLPVLRNPLSEADEDYTHFGGLEKLRLSLLLTLISAQSGLLSNQTQLSLQTAALERNIMNAMNEVNNPNQYFNSFEDEQLLVEAEIASVAPLCIGILNEWGDPTISRLVSYATKLHPRIMNLTAGVTNALLSETSQKAAFSTSNRKRQKLSCASVHDRKNSETKTKETPTTALIQILLDQQLQNLKCNGNGFSFNSHDDEYEKEGNKFFKIAATIAFSAKKQEQIESLKTTVSEINKKITNGLLQALCSLDGIALWTPLSPIDPQRDLPIIKAATWQQRRKLSMALRRVRKLPFMNDLKQSEEFATSDYHLPENELEFEDNETLSSTMLAENDSDFLSQTLIAEWPHISVPCSITGTSGHLTSSTVSSQVKVLQQMDMVLFASSDWINIDDKTSPITDSSKVALQKAELEIVTRVAAARRLTARINDEARAFIQKYAISARIRMGVYENKARDSYGTSSFGFSNEDGSNQKGYVAFEIPPLEILVRSLTKFTINHARLQMRTTARVEDAVIAVMLWEESQAAIIRFERDSLDLVKAHSKRGSQLRTGKRSSDVTQTTLSRTQTLSFRCLDGDKWNIAEYGGMTLQTEENLPSAFYGATGNEYLQKAKARYKGSDIAHQNSSIREETQFKLFYQDCLKLFKNCQL